MKTTPIARLSGAARDRMLADMAQTRATMGALGYPDHEIRAATLAVRARHRAVPRCTCGEPMEFTGEKCDTCIVFGR